MNNWQANFIDTNGIRLHYTRTGGAKPPLVLAHGFSDDGLCWTPVAERLQADYDVIMIDARGHGRSSAPEEGYSIPALGAIVTAADAATMQGYIPQLQVAHIANAGHNIRREQVGPFLQVVQGFLATLPT